jgi:hypothetical protein
VTGKSIMVFNMKISDKTAHLNTSDNLITRTNLTR